MLNFYQVLLLLLSFYQTILLLKMFYNHKILSYSYNNLSFLISNILIFYIFHLSLIFLITLSLTCFLRGVLRLKETGHCGHLWSLKAECLVSLWRFRRPDAKTRLQISHCTGFLTFCG